MKKQNITFKILGACLIMMLIALNCKQDFLQGVKTSSNGKVYIPEVAGQKNIIAGLVDGQMTLDTTDKTANFMISVFRGGFGDTSAFSVEAGVSDALIPALVSTGTLPAGTVALAADAYSIQTNIGMHYQDGIMQGHIAPKVKIEALSAYVGQTVAIALELKSSSKFSINDTMRQMVVYFNVDSLLDEAIPPTNLIDPSAWQILHIADNDNVLFTINPDGSILATGGNNGHQGVFQAVQVQAGKSYTINLHVKGSGATDTWYEVYVASKAPVQGVDYTNDPSDIKRLSLNTWSGCGKAPFDGALATISCSGSGNLVKFTSAGTVYIVIKSGGVSLGTDGILASDIDFRRVQ
jgi:hypothetical protein